MHIEIPDGILPLWLWVSGFIILALFLMVAVYFAKKEEQKMPLASLFAALSLVVMSIPLGLPVHINLMVLIGVLVGPWWALIVAFIVNSILSSLGHGGITVIGLNALLLWSQALLGFYIFNLAKKIIRKEGSLAKGILGGAVTFVSLMVSFLLLGGLVFAVNLNPEEILIQDHDHSHHHQNYEHGHEEDHHEDEYDHEESYESEGDHTAHEDQNYHSEDYYDEVISFKAFFAIALPIFLYAAIIESIVVGIAISFISKGRPDLL